MANSGSGGGSGRPPGRVSTKIKTPLDLEKVKYTPSGRRSPKGELANVNAEPLSIWEHANPRAVVNMVPDAVAENIKKIPAAWLGYSDTALRKLSEPTTRDDEIRQSFWTEYFSACDENRTMRLTAVYGRLLSRQMFYELIVHNPKKLAWMLRPPVEYTYRMQNLLEMGLNQFENILSMEIDPKNTRLIGEIVKIVALLDNRVRGAVVQKVELNAKAEVRSMNAHVHKIEQPKSYAEIQAELKNIQKEILMINEPEGSDEETPHVYELERALFGGGSGDDDDDEREVNEEVILAERGDDSEVIEASHQKRDSSD